MEVATLSQQFEALIDKTRAAVVSTEFLMQLLVIGLIYLASFVIAVRLKKQFRYTHSQPESGAHSLYVLIYKLGSAIFPVLTISFLKLTTVLGEQYQFDAWLLNIALVVAVMIFLNSFINAFVSNGIIAAFMRWVGLPIVFLHLIGVLPTVIEALSSVSMTVGNVNVSAYGVTRVMFFGALLFWLGRASNTVGQDIIRNHKNLDITTKEVFAKLFEVALFCIVILLLLNIMGINLTALAVFGGAVGVGLGLGLQSIASNFISGIIILLDRSLTVGDYVELEDGSKGFVREFKMRYAVLETYDGKDILVPNEKFINSLLINWTHKDPKQRYRIDFSVAYKTDIRAMVELIKDAVAEHPQVISGEDIPFEERPDCEIDSFGDSGVNMFVEFWMEGIDDGKNRVGGDLLLIVFETLQANNIEIPFPQREVRVLNESAMTVKNTTP
ncbi:mechanosensitive ion channel family protein [Alteromonas halophila]|uniref:Mechanosensitive ion channel protein n=1 Tax=Alteromonas halophila TaxID=516698 RepID=A0A918JPB2_9ALTE|nr:mechanosensitive ion channel domain-containing protein [Alteromonas halophila]GGW93520.1 mechanosensitive ion channel protein [Alteromonas halophila]